MVFDFNKKMDTEEKKKFKKKAPWDAFVSSEAEVKYKGIRKVSCVTS